MNDQVFVQILDGVEQLIDPKDNLLFVVNLAPVPEVYQKGIEIATLLSLSQKIK